jgi:hypothetical protein
MVRTWLVLSVLVIVGFGARTVVAAEPEGAAPVPVEGGAATAPAAATSPAATSPAPAAPAPSAPAPDTGTDPTDATAGVPMIDAAAQAGKAARYGLGARMRYTSVPKWLLGLFLDESMPLSSYTVGIEGFRRSGNFDLVMGIAYQPLSPSPGNWLGSGNPPAVDTDYIQFDGLAAWSVDAAFILHTEFNEYVGMHYGGGVGIGITTGRMLRSSAGSGQPSNNPCVTDPGNTAVCYPICNGQRCTETDLKNSEGGTDAPGSPSRFADSHIPAVYPIVNLITGLDVRLPSVPGFAVKFDMGYFFPYFFFGGSIAYQL